jgi:hypothetical protein
MRQLKTYTSTIDIDGPDDFAAAPHRAAMKYLLRMFEGRCYKGAYVLKIEKILRLSPAIIKSTNLSAQAYADVEYVALVDVKGRWDIVSGVKIARMSPLILGRAEINGVRTAVSVLEPPEAGHQLQRALAVGSLVSVRLLQAEYQTFLEEAVAVGTLLTCDRKAPAFIVEGGLTRADADALEPYAARLRDLLAAREAAYVPARTEDFLFFEQLLYSYAVPRSDEPVAAAGWSGPAGVPLPSGVQCVELLALVGSAAALEDGGAVDVSGVWCRDLALHRSRPVTARVATAAAAPEAWEPLMASAPFAVFVHMFQSCCEFQEAVLAYVETFGGQADLVRAHTAVWGAMRRAQLEPPASG